MEEFNGENVNNGAILPTNVSVWTKIKNFLFQDVTVELTPKQEQSFKSIHDFWHQEITSEGVHSFLFQKIELK